MLFLLWSLACDKQETPPAKTATSTAANPGDVPAPADVAAPPADATKTATGLAYKVINHGTGTDHPTEWDEVTVNYTGWTTDGKMFDSSTKRGKPATFKLNQVVKGWTEGLQLMSSGDTYRFWIPVELAYNNKPGKPAGMLVFDVELVSIKAAPKPPDAPSDVAAAPADATKTASGLAYKVLKKGTSADHAGPTDKVEVNYTGWTTDGKMFDSSIPRGRTSSFGLDQVIPGWTEGMQLMSPGDSYRFWIPKEMAYNDAPGKPAGMLVFDVDLVSVIMMPKTPEDVAAAPKSAKKTASGMAYRVLQKGTGAEHPSANSTVVVHYSGWTTDGKMFDSSVARGKPATFRLDQVIPGWTEGVQLMVVGEKTRFWIPAGMAYGDTPKRPGAPSGPLTFDVELVEIKAAAPASAPGSMPVAAPKPPTGAPAQKPTAH